MGLVNAKIMMKDAYKKKYAVPHININNLEWAKTVLLSAQDMRSPLILATSEGAVKYMGGYKTVYGMVKGLIEDLKITIPVALHLDHGSYEACLKAIASGYTSVMYDGSHEDFKTNLKNTKKLLKVAVAAGVSVEAEVGTIGGEEDGIVGNGDLADPAEAKKMTSLGIDMLAAGIGNIHGPYPESWKSLNFEALQEISAKAKIGLVLHGGSGIPKDQIQKAISLGISKINVNTELQQANAKAIWEFVESGKAKQGKNFDPRKLYAPGSLAMRETVIEKIKEFGSENRV
ncbi:class II fructose-1,6-bisphosphate aldolase [Mesomycoplasma lagogenitalium]|uniref:Class II fructose-1,6-bisphosphate aldolase n=1 Tax=Mesomycoplasma lagogenitalium TaxID=171286 RepID=A0ABY8LU09_9BACT|nr:class II fructose-1,6-bisphosphate aldolase [Mesomycoplasma lagogenitalium]WGI36728.1 class II fructose-1,6-bisphosphate aldolase [Mesomycoplasma lagogenitalium]